MSHQTISFIKSAIRFAGYIMLGIGGLVTVEPHLLIAAGLLIASEVVGVYEEIGH